VEYNWYQTLKDGEPIGNNLIATDSKLVMFTLTRFTEALIQEGGDDALKDMALFSISDPTNMIGGRLLLLDMGVRLGQMSEERRDVAKVMFPEPYVITLQVISNPASIPIAHSKDEYEARAIFQSWLDFIGPGHTIRIPLPNGDTILLWEPAGRPGIKVTNTIRVPYHPYQSTICPN